MNLNEKSRLTSLFLTVLLGPLGLFYSSAVGALVLCVLAFLSVSTVIGPVICWVLAIAIGDHCTHRHNQSIQKLGKMMASK